MIICKNKLLRLPSKDNWKGRTNDSMLDCPYWFNQIELIQNDLFDIALDDNIQKIGLIGYACDEGVNRNQGRVGAANGPQVLRERLAKLPIHFQNKQVFDFGDIICLDNDVESSQEELRNIIQSMLVKKVFPITIGGGHDVAFGNFMGVKDFLDNYGKGTVGILNFDAHFDLRPKMNQATSGTVFSQINSEYEKLGDEFKYFVIGIQQQSNSKGLFDIADNLKVDYILNHDCEISNFEEIKTKLSIFLNEVDYLYITVDLDGFSSAYAPGVSAPSPLGFSPAFVFKVLNYLFSLNKVIACDIAELNPRFDRDYTTAILAARLVDQMVLNY